MSKKPSKIQDYRGFRLVTFQRASGRYSFNVIDPSAPTHKKVVVDREHFSPGYYYEALALTAAKIQADRLLEDGYRPGAKEPRFKATIEPPRRTKRPIASLPLFAVFLLNGSPWLRGEQRDNVVCMSLSSGQTATMPPTREYDEDGFLGTLNTEMTDLEDF